MEKNKKDILVGFIIFVLEISLLYFLWKNNIALTISLLVISAIVLLKFANKKERIFYFLGFIFLQIFDLILVSRGVWNYGNPTIFNVPLWLPVSYGLATVMIVKIGTAISNILSN